MVLKVVQPARKINKATRTRVDTILVTPQSIGEWALPPFQRPLNVNEKVRALALQIKDDDGVIPGVLTIGMLDRKRYLLDGQHRREAFLLSGCVEGYTDVRYAEFDTMAEMGVEFVNLQSQLVRMRPDDVLRGLEASVEGLAIVREKCPFVGYDQVRRNGKSGAVLSMSAALRCWSMSAAEVPTGSGDSAAHVAQKFTVDDAREMVLFLNVAFKAWGRDSEYWRLWANLNLLICMWVYRRTVITQWSPRTPKLTRDQFMGALMALSADSTYLSWLIGRNVGERDRSPCYQRIKSLMVRRISEEMGKKIVFPAPPWASH